MHDKGTEKSNFVPKSAKKYYRYRSNYYLALYRYQRNVVTSIKRNEIKKYFQDKCNAGTSKKDFWKSIKPFFSKSRTKTDSIPLREGEEIITDDQRVCNIFNKFFQKIGYDIGNPEDTQKPFEEILKDYDEHESIDKIKSLRFGRRAQQDFTFKFISEREVIKVMKSLSTNKAVGYDEIPAKFVKKIAHKLSKPLTQIINRCIIENAFPSKLKNANISPVYKKKDKLNKDNFR